MSALPSRLSPSSDHPADAVAAIVVDLGGTFLRIALAGDRGVTRLESVRLAPLAERDGAMWSGIVDAVAAFSDRLQTDGVSADDGVAIAFPGPTRDDLVVAGAPTLLGARACPPDLAADVARATARRTVLLNDVSAAAWYFGDKLDDERFIVVTVSSGIGAKLFDRGRSSPIIDVPAHAGELGHVVVETGSEAAPCDCGGLGHLGAIASGRGFERFARKQLGDPALTNERDLVPALQRREPRVLALLEATTAPLARVLAPVIIAAGLTRVVVMGGFARTLGTIYRDALVAQLAASFDCGPIDLRLDRLVEVCGADEEPSLSGAARYARARACAV